MEVMGLMVSKNNIQHCIIEIYSLVKPQRNKNFIISLLARRIR